MRGIIFALFSALDAKIGWYRQAEPTITVEITTTWELTSKLHRSKIDSYINLYNL